MSLLLCFVMLLLVLVGCVAAAPTPEAATVVPTDRPTLQRQPTITPRLIETATATLAPTLPPPPTQPEPTSALDRYSSEPVAIGTSREGRALNVRRYGTGGRVLLLVGGIHGGWERNTVRLMEDLIAHFTATPNDIPADVSLMIVPAANPDGLALRDEDDVRGLQTRFNAAGVDLNRNWSCEWAETAFWQQARVNPGERPFSEPETQALADFIMQVRPAAVLFYHSAANGVFAGECNGIDGGSQALAQVLGEAAGYPYTRAFTSYPLSGVASNWVAGQGIPSADVELRTAMDNETEQNLRGVLAVLAWLAG